MKKIEPNQLFLKRIPRSTADAFLAAISMPMFASNQWYLAGGTALSLQVGHRKSVDLDFFTPLPQFDELSVERTLLNSGDWVTSYRQVGTIFGNYKKAKMSLISYPFFKPSSRYLQCKCVRILDPKDIAAMKIIAISQRGRKRDFIDLYWYCLNREDLFSIILYAVHRYPGQEKNLNHLLKSLTYFSDAELDPMPEIFFETSWNQVKSFFQKQIPLIYKKYIDLD